MEIDRREITPELIEDVTQTIVDRFNPRRIVLFGSWARGDARPDSDIDLFIEMESDLARPKRAIEVSSLFGLHWWPMDIVVYTPEEIERISGVFGTFLSIIEDEGKVLYERKA